MRSHDANKGNYVRLISRLRKFCVSADEESDSRLDATGLRPEEAASQCSFGSNSRLPYVRLSRCPESSDKRTATGKPVQQRGTHL
jgi:hypothetical protein